jgi:hypothetical protein
MPLKMSKAASELHAAAQGVKGKDYTQHLQTKPVAGEVSTSKSSGGAIIAESLGETQTLNPGVFSDGMSITVEGGRTLNLGNYESARIGVTITVPCSKDTLDDAYTFATQWVSDKIDEAVKTAKE